MTGGERRAALSGKPPARTAAEIAAANSDEWNAWAEAHVRRALEAEREFMTEVLGMVLAEERGLMRAAIAEQIGLLRAEITIEEAHDTGKVLDLPALPKRRSDVA